MLLKSCYMSNKKSWYNVLAKIMRFKCIPLNYLRPCENCINYSTIRIDIRKASAVFDKWNIEFKVCIISSEYAKIFIRLSLI